MDQVWNPAFDVSPADLITGIITERGPVPRAASGAFQVTEFMKQSPAAIAPLQQHIPNGSAGAHQQNGTADHFGSPTAFVALNVDTVRDYLASKHALAAMLGPVSTKPQWQVCKSSRFNTIDSCQLHYHHLCASQHVTIPSATAQMCSYFQNMPFSLSTNDQV